MAPIGQFYEENGVRHFTFKLADYLRPCTRHYKRSASFYEEVLSMEPGVRNQVLEMEFEGGQDVLRGDTQHWAKFGLCGPEERRLQIHFIVSAESQGVRLTYRFREPALNGSAEGPLFESIERLIEALDCVGLPGREICSVTDRIYLVTGPQLRMLHFAMPGN